MQLPGRLSAGDRPSRLSGADLVRPSCQHRPVGGVDTVRGIAYQQAQAVLTALDVLDDLALGALRIEGVDDVVDIELLTTVGPVCHAKQVKTRAEPYTWGEAELVGVLRRWSELPEAAEASFEFLTDGRLGPTGEKVRTALEDAARGDRQVLADVLGVETASAACAALAKARVRVDPVGVGALLLRAERQVAAMLPQPRTVADAQEQAARAVGRLFQLLFERGGDPDSEARVVTREQIATTLGVPADQPAADRWPGSLRDRYLAAACALRLDAVVPSVVEPEGQVRPVLRRFDGLENPEPLDASTVLLSNGAAMLAGRTGTGKSTTARTLCRDAARTGQVVLLAHAETYLPGRLEALAADAISDLLAQDLPFATGRQVLADREVTLVIDGVSEVPTSVRNAMHDDLLAPVAGRQGARILVLGRDIAALRDVLPSSVTSPGYLMSELDADRRVTLAARMLRDPQTVDGEQHAESEAVRTLVAQVEHGLGDAAGNPLLFTMGLSLVDEGIPFTSRVTLYDRFVERLAERSGAADIAAAVAALGLVYVRLLDQGRRYADPYEWARLMADAAAKLEGAGLSANARALDEAARRSGLISPIGYTQTLAPMHDSFADYLAGTAHAQGLAPFPTRLQPGDEQRVLFAAEVGGVDAALATLVARDQPFLVVRLARFDRRELTEGAPAEVETMLRRLLPGTVGHRLALWRRPDGRVVAVRHDEDGSTWVDEPTAQRLLATRSAVVVEENAGPLKVAVRLWRRELLARLRTANTLPARRPNSLNEACSALVAHAEQAAAATASLIAVVAPPGHATVLAGRVGPVGLNATVQTATEGIRDPFWPVSYRHSETVRVVAAPVEGKGEGAGGAPNLRQGGHSSVEALIGDPPAAAAANRVRAALHGLTVRGWLSPE